MFRSMKTGRVAIAALACTLLATACTSAPTSSPSAGSAGAAAPIKVWIEEDLPERVAATKKIVEAYTAKTGGQVDLVSISEDEFNQLLTSSAAAGDLPDVIGGVSLPQVRTMSANQLIDTAATGEVLNTLGAATFAESGLALTKDGDTQLAIPSESWTQLLLYRKDLFDKAALKAPGSYADISAAAKQLDSSEVAGFVGANLAGDAFTEQTFEHVALGNNCQLVDNAGTVTLDSTECVESFSFYGDLVENYSVPGAQDVDTVRAQYFSGKAAMAIWSTFILDELAGLRNDAKPNCAQCKDDPTWLAKNTGVVTAISGPKGSQPAVFGEVTSWVIPAEAESASAKAFLEFMLNDGYMDWIAIAPEGGAGAQGHGRRTHEVQRRMGQARGRCRLQSSAGRFLRPRGDRSTDHRRGQAGSLGDPAGPGQPARCDSGRASGGRRGEQGDLRGGPGRGSQEGRGRGPVHPGIDQVSGGGHGVSTATPAETRGAARGNRGPVSARGREDRRVAAMLVSPTVLIVVVMVVLPILWTISLAFQRVRLLNLRNVGIFGNFTVENFSRVIASSGFVDALVVTLLYSVLGTAGAIGLGLIAALALRKPFRGRGLVRASLLLPYVAPVVAATFVWKTMLHPQFGLINHWGQTLFGWRDPIAFLSSSENISVFGVQLPISVSLLTVIVFEAWRSFPFAFLFLTARLEAIPGSLEEAGWVDGATPLQSFRHIVLPQLMPTIAVLTVLRFIWTFNNFDDIYLLTGGGSGTQVVTVRVFDYLMARGDIGAAAAQALVLAAILAVLVGVYLKLFGRSEEAA